MWPAATVLCENFGFPPCRGPGDLKQDAAELITASNENAVRRNAERAVGTGIYAARILVVHKIRPVLGSMEEIVAGGAFSGAFFGIAQAAQHDDLVDTTEIHTGWG